MFRHRRPTKMLKDLAQLHSVSIVSEDTGIYRIDGLFTVPIRIIVTSEISGGYEALKLLSKQVSTDTLRRFVDVAKNYSDQGDIEHVKSVLEVFTEVNRPLISEIKEGIDMMGPALRELMHDDLEAAMSQGIELGKEQGIEQAVKAVVSTCKKLGGSSTDAIEMVMLNMEMDQLSAEVMVKKYWS